MCKAMRIAAQAEPELASRCMRLQRSGQTLQQVLTSTVADRTASASHRRLAAELLSVGGVGRPFESIIDQYLEQCDGATAWDLQWALPYGLFHPTRDQERRPAQILRGDPDEERRAATAQFLGSLQGRGSFQSLLETLQDRSETGYVRGRAAEALISHGKPAAVPALTACLSDPDPVVRFWAVFALGGIAHFRPALHGRALTALRMVTEDTGQMSGYWSVGYEARAMIEGLDPEQRKLGEEERSRILARPESPPDLRRWAEFYTSPVPDRIRTKYIEARYRKLRWSRPLQRVIPA